MTELKSEKKILLGFAGGAGVGKTTTAKWFVEQLGYVRLAYAAPLKASLSVLTGLPIGHFMDIEMKETEIPGLDTTPRIMMQKMGTEFVRNMIHPDFWLWRMRHAISDHSDRNIVIDDVRFDNEAQLVRDNGGIVVHLVRDYRKPTGQTSHESEQQLMFEENDIVVNSLDTEELTAKHIFDLINE